MRHLGQVRGAGMSGNVAAQGEGQLGGRLEVDLLEDPAQGDDVEVLVRDLDAQDALAWDGSLDADGARGQGHGQIVGQGLDTADLDLRRGLHLVLGDDGPGVPGNDPGRNAEAGKLGADDRRVPFVVHPALADARREVVQKRQRRQVIFRPRLLNHGYGPAGLHLRRGLEARAGAANRGSVAH